MLFGHTCGLEVFMGVFKEKVRRLTSVLRDPGMWVPLSFLLLGVICQVAALLGTLRHTLRQARCLGSVHFSGVSWVVGTRNAWDAFPRVSM